MSRPIGIETRSSPVELLWNRSFASYNVGLCISTLGKTDIYKLWVKHSPGAVEELYTTWTAVSSNDGVSVVALWIGAVTSCG